MKRNTDFAALNSHNPYALYKYFQEWSDDMWAVTSDFQ